MKLDDVRVHLFRKGFVPDYYVWNRHGEPYGSTHFEQSTCHLIKVVDAEPTNPYRQMILDATGPEFENDFMEKAPNLNAQKFYDMLNAVDEKLWDGVHYTFPNVCSGKIVAYEVRASFFREML